MYNFVIESFQTQNTLMFQDNSWIIMHINNKLNAFLVFINYFGHFKISYLLIIYPNSHAKLTNSEIILSCSRFEHLSHTWYTSLETRWHWFDLSMLSNVKCQEVNWKTIYIYIYFIICVSYKIWSYNEWFEIQPFESYATFIWPLNVIKGQMSWGKLIGHAWLPICVYNKLWSQGAWFMKYQAENSMTLICHFNLMKGHML